MKKMSKKSMFAFLMMTALMYSPAYADGFSDVASPIVNLINTLLNPALTIVGALGALYCIILGVKYARAEDPQEQMKAKNALKNAIVGFVLIFVLIVALRLSMPALTKWVNESTKNVTAVSLVTKASSST